jgi:hypothetical protein
MRTLELKDICGYLPHGLKASIFDYERERRITGDIVEIRAINAGKYTKDIELLVSDGEYGCYETPNMIHPILRPLSDLYRSIIHNGEEITPIVVLTKLMCPDLYWNIEDFEQNDYGNRLKIKIYRNLICVATDKGKVIREITRTGKLVRDAKWNYQSYDLLNFLKIDYRGLIGEGLAIDCNTLADNPYK